ncbi:protein kinase domain-containing protein [Methylibium sp.]|uniref:protein kinase domain-containing protein n=1 Tax=Methylibium sp. TaxID=2067992 RepID=UPI003D0F0BDC
MPKLRIGQRLLGTNSGLPVVIEAFLGEGGQGEVYRVLLGPERFALKWYNERMLAVDPRLRGRIEAAIEARAPLERFLWPFELVTRDDGSGLGYLMRLRGEQYVNLVDLIGGDIRPSFRVLALLCFQLADAFFALHAKGLSYQDISAANVFVDPRSGDIQICDNDNVDVDGAASVMGGTPEYQSPELVLRRGGPRRTTDLYALAVLLFRVLHVGHPLIGRREFAFANIAAPEARGKLYGSEPVFVFDPVDESNRPDPQVHGPVIAHWSIYPQFVKDLFTKAFTEGLFDPEHGRVQETQWRRAMSQLRDAVMVCSGCGGESCYDARRVRQGVIHCWGCDATLSAAPPRIGLRRAGARSGEAPAHVVILEPGVLLHPHHTSGGEYDFSRITAEVLGQPLALMNRSSQAWTAVFADRSEQVVPGAALLLENGLRVRFGHVEGEVKL